MSISNARNDESRMKAELVQACTDYKRYLQLILLPAMAEIEEGISARRLRLHQIFGANLYLAHAVDYIQKIRRTSGIVESRTSLVQRFDELFSVDGARFGSKKFELIDAINNALKHIRLDRDRYEQLEICYGPISFQSLVEDSGDVLCVLDGYRFDYARVVLRPAWTSLAGGDFEEVGDILDFALGTQGGYSDSQISSGEEWDDPIDRMIEHCNPSCDDCGEQESECRCSQYIYEGKEGRFEPVFRTSFDFDEVMSRISGAYQRDRD